MTPLRIAVIVGSTREGRVGDRLAHWFVEQAARHDDLTVTVVDLTEYDFPAAYPAEPTASIRAFVREVGRADAFVVVTPEYNHSFPAPLKEAIDYAYDEWQAKPVGFVSYGCRSTGLHAVDQLRTVFTALHATTVRDVVGIDLLGGEPTAQCTDELGRDVGVLLDQLRWWGLALRDGRAARPYVS
ncbi:NADPH-dependent FMN reductase [Micromonospora vinacea]|uniref:NAD(P)H-dependent FMN reductase n=1 Tax=Micromonospora vinacea TaxID=709878 RepID=A0ABS0K1J4_9ACTN|nr:NAD(P)H-dependent oxidoreductase [Micromonospora vinacea]MBG6102501.1 NAD(P)H-dependent FMN reductase [Micromonospora vinacea]WSZ74722.1 NAD(P)H-dependent oxidoreductase [Micromonospora sp. NBC_00860]WTA68791.1 NAD(P)H-dependent oxidoreductase [Micromonospora sp. NBC_00855]